MKIHTAGKHLILDLHGVSAKKLSNENLIRERILDSIELSGATILHYYFHPFGEDMGVTGIVALSESHVSIHTWPEWEYAAVDIFLCGKCDPDVIAENLIDKFKPSHYNISTLLRTAQIEE